MTAVANWILFRSKSTQWNDAQVQQLQSVLQAGRETTISASQIRQLDIAAQLHSILKNNEERPSFQRDDAKALAEGMQLLINANTQQGKVDEPQLIEDIQLFTIDSAKYEAGRLKGQAKDSNAAYNLVAGPRIGTVGWKEKYWDHGKQYESDKNGKKILINQAHHFTFFFMRAIDFKDNPTGIALLKKAAYLIDTDNPQDQALARLAIELGKKINDGKID